MKFFKFNIYLASIISSLLMVSCIKNDIPLPVEVLTIENISGEGFTMNTPDYANRIITLELEETTDPSKVNIESAIFTNKATLSEPLVGEHDLRTPKYVTLSLYQDYEWQIRATQQISRSFKVEGQIGDAVIDAENHTALAYVSKQTDLSNITVTELKLGPEKVTVYSHDINDMKDFNAKKYVYITYHTTDERWSVSVEQTDLLIDLTKCDIWAKSCWLEASGDTSLDCGFRYRKVGEQNYTEIPKDQITFNEGAFSTEATNLLPETEYEFIAYAGDNISQVAQVTSQKAAQLENSDFEDWSKPSKSWLPYADGGVEFWGSGNPGATTIGDQYNLTTPESEDIRPNSEGIYSAKLQSRNVVVKFAAGSIYTGKYIKTAGTNGIVGFGRPFTSRPKAIRGWMKYTNGVIDVVGIDSPPGVTIIKGETKDSGMIYAALGTWTPEEYGYSSKETEMQGSAETPLIVDTRDKSTFFNPKSEAVVAYGDKVFTESVDEWVQFEIPLDYTSTSQIPTHIIIVCSASRYGDYFTGSSSSVMYLDDIELVY